MSALVPLERRFYQRETIAVARDLLGKLIVRRLPEGVVAVRLTEVEAYLGVGDAACHTFDGRRTPRTETMWGEAGLLYVYFTYGMHHCANVVTRGPGVPEAVLLRGAVPVHGRGRLTARRGRDGPDLLDGPGKLCQALGLSRENDGADLARRGAMFLADDGLGVPDGQVGRAPRVGVAYAGEAASWPLRFLVAPRLRTSPPR